MTDEEQILTTLSKFSKGATEEDIRAALFLQQEIDIREAMLALLYEHKIAASWPTEDEPVFSSK